MVCVSLRFGFVSIFQFGRLYALQISSSEQVNLIDVYTGVRGLDKYGLECVYQHPVPSFCPFIWEILLSLGIKMGPSQWDFLDSGFRFIVAREIPPEIAEEQQHTIKRKKDGGSSRQEFHLYVEISSI